jgi:murein DD-endopeptidase MepM/ murein hydrolase activator NlpD
MSLSRRLPTREKLPSVVGAALLALFCFAAPAAQAQVAKGSGSISAPGTPEIEKVRCLSKCVSGSEATAGATVRVKGAFLDYTKQVVFRGPSGPLPTPISGRLPTRVDVVVPAGAVTSRPYVIDNRGMRSNRAPRKLRILPVSSIPTGVFPVRGPHTYGDGFGAQRSGHKHQGQDILAACGLPIVSAVAGRVQYRAYQSAAGNYAVIDSAGSNVDMAYMHMVKPAIVQQGQAVAAGQQIGNVGQTGDATGCHLHFEYWVGDWWGGGAPIDPLPYLKQWDKTS